MIIEKDNNICSTTILDEENFIIELKRKLDGELLEYKEAETNKTALEELADILEPMHALAETYDADIETIEEIRKDRVEKRGGFKGRIFLIEIED